MPERVKPNAGSRTLAALCSLQRNVNGVRDHVGELVELERALVRDASGRLCASHARCGGSAPEIRAIVEIADCSERINLEFELDSELDVENWYAGLYCRRFEEPDPLRAPMMMSLML
jgi:hypothetical protein